MRMILLGALALLLAGCEHMYGGVDLSDTEAVEIARSDAARRRVLVEGRVPVVGHHGDGTTIEFTRPECINDACAELPLSFFIPAGRRRVTHFHNGTI